MNQIVIKTTILINHNWHSPSFALTRYQMRDTKCTQKKRCTVLLREEVYRELSNEGRFKESFSDLISRLLTELAELKKGSMETVDVAGDTNWIEHRRGEGFEWLVRAGLVWRRLQKGDTCDFYTTGFYIQVIQYLADTISVLKEKLPLKRPRNFGGSVIIAIDPSHVKRLNIDIETTFFVEKPVENGILLEIRRLREE
jgi:predicted CopG family antitoxin